MIIVEFVIIVIVVSRRFWLILNLKFLKLKI